MVGRILLLSFVIFLILVPDEAEAWRRRRRCTRVNCAISWSSWGSCSSSCMGTQRRTGWITRQPSCGGSACDPLAQTRSCNNVCQNGGWRAYYPSGCRCRPGFSGRCCERASCREGQTQYNRCRERCRCRGGRLTECTRIRKEFTTMTTAERTKYVNTVKIASTNARYKAEYDRLITVHRTLFSQQIHDTNNFLPWHRWYILQYENLLRKVDCTVTVAYWDWSRVSSRPWRGLSTDLWSTGSSGFGGNGNPCVRTGPFSWPAWKLVPSAGSSCLQRQFIGFPPDTTAVSQVLNTPPSEFVDFEFELRISLHDNVHCLIMGTMCTTNAASTPEFFLHHGFIDKLWADWQAKSSCHHSAHFSTLSHTMPGTSHRPREFLDLKAHPGGVRVEYKAEPFVVLNLLSASVSHKPQVGGQKARPRFTTVNQRAMELFHVSAAERQRAKELAKKLDPK